VSLEETEPVPKDRPEAATKQLNAVSLPTDSAYCVVAITPYDRHRRRVYLSLHSAIQAVERTRKRGLPAELILCKLVPVQATLDLDGEVTS
jgi:hypothetical protein